MIGTALTRSLGAQGHSVSRLVRRTPASADEIAWDPAAGTIDAARLEGFDAVVHLAGENIAEGRWTSAKRDRIRDSRVQGTTLLAKTLASLEDEPKVLVSASAIGFYGDRGEDEQFEDADPGHGFLPDVCAAWENAANPAREAGIRVVHPRIGVVLGRDGGALAKMLFPFKMGVGGPIGSGRNWMSWISLDDQVRVIERAIEDESLSGPVNSCAPEPVRFADFARVLGKVLRRPAFVRTPAIAMRLALGAMVDDLLLASIRVSPRKLSMTGFEFEHPDLETALRAILERPELRRAS